MKFSKEFLQDSLGGDKGLGVVDVYDEISDTTRWSICHDRVFQFEGKFYSAPYSVGATEYQDERPYEYDDDQIECPEMEAIKVEVIQWKVKA